MGKYKGEFYTLENKQCIIEIYNTKTKRGGWKNLILSGKPLSILSSEVKLEESIMGLGAEIEIVVDSYDNINQLEYESLFTSKPQSYKVDISLDNHTIFKGFVDTEMYQESFINPPYKISLSASDGLKGLKNYEVEVNGFNSLETIIEKCLNKTGLRLPIWSLNTMISEDMNITNKSYSSSSIQDLYNSQVKSCFQLSQVNGKAFKDKDALSVLENILKSFSCKVYQEKGEWRIDRTLDKINTSIISSKNEIRLDTFESPIKGHEFERLDIRERDLTPIEIGKIEKEDYPFINNKQKLEVNSPYGKQVIKGELTKEDGTIYISESTFLNKQILHKDTPLHPEEMIRNKWYISEYANQDNSDKNINSFQPISDDPFFENGCFKLNKASGSFYDNGAFNLIDGKYVRSAPLDRLAPFVGMKKIVSGYYVKDTKSDMIRVSLKYIIKCDELDPDKDFIRIPLGISFKGNDDWFHTYFQGMVYQDSDDGWFDGRHSSYIYGNAYNYDLEPRATYIEALAFSEKLTNSKRKDPSPSICFPPVRNTGNYSCQYPFRFIDINISDGRDKDGYYKGEVSISIENNKDGLVSDFGGNFGDINHSLNETFDLTFMTSMPIIFTKNPKKAYYSKEACGNMRFPDEVSIGDIKVNVNEEDKYDNTITGKLNEDYLRQAPKISLALWNSVKRGESDIKKGIVSASSSWVNFNHSCNIYKYYGSYIDTTKLDVSSGLGLWYSLNDRYGHSSLNLGNRLLVHILKDYFTLYSDVQNKISGTIYTNKLPTISTLYNVKGKGDKQFLLTSRTYNVYDCKCSIKLHELRNEEIKISK